MVTLVAENSRWQWLWGVPFGIRDELHKATWEKACPATTVIWNTHAMVGTSVRESLKLKIKVVVSRTLCLQYGSWWFPHRYGSSVVRTWCTCNFIWASFLSDYLALLVLFILITTNGIEILSTSNSTTTSFASRYVPMYIIMFMGMEQIVLSPISYNYSICFLHHLQYVHTQKEAYLPTFPKFWDMQSQKLISYPTVLEASKLLWKFVACT